MLLEQLSKNNNAAVNTMVAEDGGRTTEVVSNTDALANATDMRLAALNESDAETSSAEETEKLVGSFLVKNGGSQGTGEVMLVLIQPDGKVLKDAWESGSFDADGGRKTYSRKIKFDYSKGEARRLNFAVPLDNCQKGTYTLQVYSKGKIIGKTVKVIS